MLVIPLGLEFYLLKSTNFQKYSLEYILYDKKNRVPLVLHQTSFYRALKDRNMYF